VPEDYDEPFVTLTGDNGSGVVKAFANDELEAFKRADPHRTPSPHTCYVLCLPIHSCCGFETPVMCRLIAARMTSRLF